MGSGVLGGQIAWHSAYRGKNVTVRDIADEPLAKCKKAHERYAKIYSDEMNASAEDIEATKKRLTFTTDLEVATKNVDLVIEAVPEVLKIKESVYKDLAPLLPKHTILATNSSSLLPSSFVQYTGRPDKFCAMHFANLIWKLNLVEIMAQPQSLTG